MKKNILNRLLLTTILLTEINTYCMNNNNSNYKKNQMAINLLKMHINFINDKIDAFIVEIENLKNANENANVNAEDLIRNQNEINYKTFRLEDLQELKITNKNLLLNIEKQINIENSTFNAAREYKYTLSFLKKLYALE